MSSNSRQEEGFLKEINNYLKNHGKILYPLALFLIFLSILVLVYHALDTKIIPLHPTLPLKEDANFVQVLSGAIIITLVVERTLEVFTSIARDQEKINTRHLAYSKAKETVIEKINSFENTGENLKNELIYESDYTSIGRQGMTDKMHDLAKTLDKDNKIKLYKGIDSAEDTAKEIIENYRYQTEKLTFLIGFVLGLLSSILGIRVLEPLVDTSNVGDSQLFYFRFFGSFGLIMPFQMEIPTATKLLV